MKLWKMQEWQQRQLGGEKQGFLSGLLIMTMPVFLPQMRTIMPSEPIIFRAIILTRQLGVFLTF